MTQPLTPKYLDSVIRKPEKIRVSETHPVSIYGTKRQGVGNSIAFEMKYTFPKGTPRKYLALGSYPKQSLRSIRDKALWAKNLIADGKDPKQEKLIEEMGLNKDDSFRRVCLEYFEQEWKPNKSKTHVKRFEALLERLLKGSIGRLSISAINEQMLRERLLPIRNSSQDQANRLCRWLANMFDYAIPLYGIRNNPAHTIRKQFSAPQSVGFKTIDDEVDFKQMISDVLAYDAKPQTDHLFLVALLTGARIGSIVPAQWREIDWDRNLWTIPEWMPEGIFEERKSRTKKPQNKPPKKHPIFITTQLKTVLNNLRALIGNDEQLFPSFALKKIPWMSKETVSRRINRAANGIYKDKQDTHGFRISMASFLNENYGHIGNTRDAVELMSLREPDGKVRRKYDKSTHWELQCKLWQHWADHVESLLPRPIAEIGLRKET